MARTDRIAQELWVCHLGNVPYRDALAIQDDVRARRQADELPDALLLLEHPPVYTRGRRSGAEDLPFPEDFYRAKGIDVLDTDRGGRLTYHGPGQLVGYPIMAIADVGRFLRTIEDAIVRALAEQGIRAGSRHQEGVDYTGVWVQERKIASIGLHVSRGVTTHGFAVNVENDLEPFSWVLACGLPDVRMTSVAAELAGAKKRAADDESAARKSSASSSASELACFRKRMAFHFARAHGRRQRLVSPWRLGIDAANASRGAALRPTRPELGTTIPAAPVDAVPA
jgi:lipoyl(octanoyl) transferase